ncbi:MAG: hypothetical protein IT290_06315, partial [Deltaproteobacteria bacterium]|nr:hypothetical protein [Deltaproteobacteria bacterium]
MLNVYRSLAFAIAASGLAVPSYAEFSAPCPYSQPRSFDAPSGKLKLTVVGARIEGGIDTDVWPFIDRADIYGRVFIEDEQFNLPIIDESDSPSWSSGNIYQKTIPSGEDADVSISLFDADGNLSGDRDIVDINPSAAKKVLNFSVDLCSMRLRTPEMATGVSLPMQVMHTFRGDDPSSSEFGEVDFRVETVDGLPTASSDIALTHLEPVQVVHGASALVSEKPFVVMARISNTYTLPIDTEIDITVSGAGISRTDRFPVAALQPGEVRRVYYYTDSPLVPSIENDSGTIRLSARLDPQEKFSGSLAGDDCRRRNDFVNETENLGVGFRVIRTNLPTIRWIRISPFGAGFLTADETRFRNLATMGSDYIQATYPVPFATRVIDYDVWSPAVTGVVLDFVLSLFNVVYLPANAATPFAMLFEINTRALIGGTRKYIGVLPGGYLPSILWDAWEDSPGVSLGPVGSRAVLVSEGWKREEDAFEPRTRHSSIALAAHEFGHTYGLSVEPSLKGFFCSSEDPVSELLCGIDGGYDEYEHENPDFQAGMPATGYWVRRGDESPQLATLVNRELCDTHGFMGSSNRADYLQWNARKRWIDRQNYEAMMRKLVIGEGFAGGLGSVREQEEKPVDSIVIAGMISRAGREKARFLPFYRVGVRIPDATSVTDQSAYIVRFVGADDSVLQEVGISPSGISSEVPKGIPLSMFAFVAPFPEGTQSIKVFNRVTGRQLLSRPVSSNAPKVFIKNGAGGFEVKKGESVEIKFRGSDKDYRRLPDRGASRLHYTVMIRDVKDKETNEWLVTHAHERGRSVTLETKFLTQR